MRFVPLTLALLAAGATAADHGAVPPAAPVGPAVDCIGISRIRATRVYGDRTIDFVTTGRRIYRNVLPHGCPGLGFERRFAYETSLGELCSTDIITVLYQTGTPRGASCGLGRFQPVTPGTR